MRIRNVHIRNVHIRNVRVRNNMRICDMRFRNPVGIVVI